MILSWSSEFCSVNPSLAASSTHRSINCSLPWATTWLPHVVRNGYFGSEAKFQLYNESKIKQAIEQRGGKSVTFPDLADRVADDLYSMRLTIDKAAASDALPFGNRAELLRWRELVHTMMGEVFNA